jgi:hypothetical protein
MRRELFRNIFAALLIVLAFFIGLFYPKSIEVVEPQPSAPQEIENRIIYSCSKNNYFVISDKKFYCFSAK